MRGLLNRKAVRDFALAASATRAHRFTRVGGAFLNRCEARLREFIRAEVARHPSRGRTIN